MNSQIRYLSLLKQYVSFPTVSLKGYDSTEAINSCINFLKNLLEEGGVTVTVWDKFKEGVNLNPVIFGNYIVDEKLPTMLVYGHYDVVAANENDWQMTSPFKLFKKGGTLYGRGSTDNKGQNLIHILTVLEGIKEKTLCYNVKFFIEGNEETGSAGLDTVIEEHKDELKTDYIIVSDGSVVSRSPVIELSLRGLVNIKVTLKTSDEDLHSGLSGGAVYNSAVEAANLVSRLFNRHGSVNVNGFYEEKVASALARSTAVSTNNLQLLSKVDLRRLFKVKQLKGAVHFDALTRIGLLPTIEVMGFSSGGGEKGFKNIIPGTTSFGLNCRIVGDQDPEVVASLVIDYLKQYTPAYVDLTTEVFASSKPVMLELQPKVKDHLIALLTEAYGEAPLDKYVGGGIPVVGHFKDILGVHSFLIPFANDTCSMHGADENIEIWCIENAFAFSKFLFSTPIK